MGIDRTAPVAVALVLLAGCSASPTAAEAFCGDLERGRPVEQLVDEVVGRFGDTADPQIAGAIFIEDAIDGCPEFRGAWEQTALYDEWWITPDDY